MNPDHPDLVEIDLHIRSHLDRVLRAEQEAADLSRRRAATLRDRLIDLEERCETVVISHAGGETAGVVESVGADHVDLATASGPMLLSISAMFGVKAL